MKSHTSPPRKIEPADFLEAIKSAEQWDLAELAAFVRDEPWRGPVHTCWELATNYMREASPTPRMLRQRL